MCKIINIRPFKINCKLHLLFGVTFYIQIISLQAKMVRKKSMFFSVCMFPPMVTTHIKKALIHLPINLKPNSCTANTSSISRWYAFKNLLRNVYEYFFYT